MPRLRVDRDTPEVELLTAIVNLFAASRVIDEKLAGRPVCDAKEREAAKTTRDRIHDEIERLTNIVRVRRGSLVSH